MEELPVNIPRFQPARLREDLDAEPEEEDDENDDARTTTGTATSTSTSDMPPPKLTRAQIRAHKKAAKAAKSQSKAFKNQKKHTISVRAEDVEAVQQVLHGDNAANQASTHPLASDKTIEEVMQRNMGFMANIESHKKQLMSSIAQRRRSDRERRKSGEKAKKRRFSDYGHSDDLDEDEEGMEHLLTAILTKLGVEAVHIASGGQENTGAKRGGSKASANSGVPASQVSIVANLKALVKDDLKTSENEQRETCIRAGGFWRYVGRPIFERMTRIAGELDWRTGMKLKDA